MKLKLTITLGTPATDATVMVTEAPVDIHDIAAMADGTGSVNLADYVVPGKYTLVISYNGNSSIHTIDLTGATEEIELTI